MPRRQPLADVPIRPAATVMLARDGDSGLEVFVLQRAPRSAFAAGMYVFPGGRVDAVDEGQEMESVCDGLTDALASARLGIEAGGLAFWAAAIRECFEEAGVLLARPAAGAAAVRFDDPAAVARFEAARAAIYGGALDLVGLCAAEGLRLMTDDIHYVAHWITPRGEPRRFDTRFFLARAPLGQSPLHDDSETVDSLWVRPTDALARRAAGELRMLPPTAVNLEFLAAYASVDAAMEAAADIEMPQIVAPRLRLVDGRPAGVVMPWEPGYDDLS